MNQAIPQDTPIYADTGRQIGTVVDDSGVQDVGVLTTEGQRVWYPRYAVKHRDGRWVVEGDYTALSSTEPQARHDERDLDEASEESFPASDPPSFTLGDEGKGS